MSNTALAALQLVYPRQPEDVKYDPFELDILDGLVYWEVTETNIHIFFMPNVSDSAKTMFCMPTLKTGMGMPKPWSLKEMFQPQYYYEYQPYLGFVPVDNIFEGPLFGHFWGNRSYFVTQVVGHGLEFQFNPALAMSWIRVQNALTMLIADFHIRLKPIDLKLDLYPTDTKFFKPWPTKEQVVNSVLFAQRLFLKLITELQYSICVSSHVDRGKWLEAMEKLRFAWTANCTWLFDLAASKVMTTEHLAGTVFCPTVMPNAELIKHFICHDCTLYIPVICIHTPKSEACWRVDGLHGVGRKDEIQTILFRASRARPKTKAIIWVWNLKDKNISRIRRRLQLINVEHQYMIFCKNK